MKLVISGAHTRLKKAISTVCQGAPLQGCRVHFMRKMLFVVPKAARTRLPRSSTPSSPNPTV
ncbi:transposase [Glaciihabitans sp. UYNi722]|uniref:transposase n=1 Tax=Glaciihabitans sp. UYNi722 TaxID=3156344 RepID=UPI003399124D